MRDEERRAPGPDSIIPCEWLRRHPRGMKAILALVTILLVAGFFYLLALDPALQTPSSHWHPLATICFVLALLVPLGVAMHVMWGEVRARRRRLRAALAQNQALRQQIACQEQRLAALALSEAKYRDLYDLALEGIFTTDIEGRFLAANPALVAMLGYESEEDLKGSVANASADLYVDQANREDITRTLLKQGTAGSMAVEVRRRDGRQLWLSVSARIIRDENGRAIAFQGSARDITERRQDQIAREQALAAAELANRAKTEFLSNMSHELRTPLNAIIGFSEIIATRALGPAGADAYVEYAQDIHASGTALLDMINDILDLSRIEAGRKELYERMVDIPRVIRTSLRLVRERADKGGITLETEMTETLPPIRADEVALKQILSNLLSNAVKFTPAGGRVICGSRVGPGGRFELVVRDTGIGMKPEDIPKAMEPFQQVEGTLSRHAGGTGLGLPLVAALARLHGGGIELESEPGRGTCVTVWLPADRVQSQRHLFRAVGSG
ncbi:PAS domain-containing sensor histidine kinase [Niveispirillum irakense]|uniref:sensor histidine kinase n=1 Tax=Niveispirillum irakense TaxID=34011 RepID=UPI0009FF1CBC|nr:PAS domain-containing sensor histidine kinase [Niveispirillum irakense]